jgi:16S rRNA pseudouridine516 synthase
MRLDRFISQHTEYSRKEVLKLIAQKRITINGESASKGAQHIQLEDVIELDGNAVISSGYRYFMLHKPEGFISATTDSHQPTALDLFDEPNKSSLHIAGRLDIDTTGLLLITDDGQWSHQVTSPNAHKSKVYLVSTASPIDPESINAFKTGIYLKYEDQVTKPADLEILSPHQARVTLYEGRYHQVKRMFGAMENKVISLHREKIGEIVLDESLAPGEYRFLSEQEVLSI